MFSNSSEEIYSEPQVLDFYTKLVAVGLYPFEQKALPSIDLQSTLVVGCGAGRETFALAQSPNCYLLCGIDINSQMVQRAKGFLNQKKSNNSLIYSPQIEFSQSDLLSYSSEKDFSTIWLTLGLTGHYLDQKQRVSIFQKSASLLREKGFIVYFPDIDEKKFGLQKRVNFGGQQDLHQAYDFYIYKNTKEVIETAQKADLSPFSVNKDAIILQKAC